MTIEKMLMAKNGVLYDEYGVPYKYILRLYNEVEDLVKNIKCFDKNEMRATAKEWSYFGYEPIKYTHAKSKKEVKLYNI